MLKCAANSDYFKIYPQAGLTSTRLYIKKRCRLTKSKSDAAFKNCDFMYAVYFILVCKPHAVRKIKSKS